MLTCSVHDRKRLILPVSTKEGFDSSEGLLDWIEVGGVWWEEHKFAAFIEIYEQTATGKCEDNLPALSLTSLLQLQNDGYCSCPK